MKVDTILLLTKEDIMKIKIKSKLLILSILLLIIPSLTVGIIGYGSAKGSLEAQGQTTLKNGVQAAIQHLDDLNEQVKEGHLTLEEAQEKARIYLLGEKNADGTRKNNNPIDLGENGYFIAYSEDGVEMAHPSLEGKKVWDAQDIDGNYIVQDQIKVAKSGGGFTYYKWPLPNNPDEIAPKVTYNEYFSDWGWVVSAGTYMMDFNEGANRLLYILIITLGISLVIGVFVIIVFANRLSKPIIKVAESMSRVSNGDLSGERVVVNNNDEIGILANSLNTMVEQLREMINKVADSSQQVASTSEELSASAEETSIATDTIAQNIQDIAIGSDKQIESINSTITIITQISGSMEQIASNVQSVNELTVKTTEKSESGSTVINNTINQMHVITDKTSNVSSIVEQLGTKSDQIGNIVSLINDISSQTNLLALNAAIEAARAGEHGKGFAVVADEVRKLAEEAGKATDQINGLIKDIQRDIQLSVSAMRDGELAVKEGTTLVNQAGSSFTEIKESVNNVSSQLQEVSAAVQQITAGTQTMVVAIEETNVISETSAGYVQNVAASAEEQNASMEEIAASSLNLSKMAEDLQNTITKFKL